MHALKNSFVHGFLLYRDFFLVPFRLLSNRIAHTNSKLLRKNWADSWMIWNKISVFEASALKCMYSFPFSILRIPRLNALALVKTGWPVSFNRCTIWDATESHFASGGYFAFPYHFFSSPAPRNVQSPCENFFAYVLTFLNSKYKSHRFLSLPNQFRWTSTWRWSDLWICQVQSSALAKHSGVSEESAMT